MTLGEFAHVRLDLHEILLYISVFAMDAAEELNNYLRNTEIPLDRVKEILRNRLIKLGLSTFDVV